MPEPKYAPRRYLSISTLIEYARCPRRYFYRKCGLRTPGVAIAPIYGQAMHKAVPVALLTEDIDKAFAAFLSVWEDAEKALFNEAIKAGEAADDPTKIKLVDPKRNRGRARLALMHFIHTHANGKSIYNLIDPPEGGIQTDDKVSDMELAWAIDIGLPVPLVGRIDGLCKHRDTGQKWVWELKTASRVNAQLMDAHEMYPQTLTYVLVARMYGVEVEGVMLEAMLVDKNKVDNMAQPVPVMQHHLDDIMIWLQTVGGSLLQAEKDYMGSECSTFGADCFLKNFTGCTPYVHYYMPMFPCEYMDLCKAEDWKSMTDLYEVSEEHDFLKESFPSDISGDAVRKMV